MTEEKKPRSLFHNFWGKKWLIFSALLIIATLIVTILMPNREAEERDPQMDFMDVLEMDSLGDIKKIKEEERTRDYVEPKRDHELWNDTM